MTGEALDVKTPPRELEADLPERPTPDPMEGAPGLLPPVASEHRRACRLIDRLPVRLDDSVSQPPPDELLSGHSPQDSRVRRPSRSTSSEEREAIDELADQLEQRVRAERDVLLPDLLRSGDARTVDRHRAAQDDLLEAVQGYRQGSLERAKLRAAVDQHYLVEEPIVVAALFAGRTPDQARQLRRSLGRACAELQSRSTSKGSGRARRPR